MADFLLTGAANAGSLDASRRLAGPIHAERNLRIVCVGAGASGLLMAYKLQKHFQNYSLAVYEKNPEVAGTWYENRYPG
jgi:cation diffusion facilitator CzcD-associated flavoprotein CzcO